MKLTQSPSFKIGGLIKFSLIDYEGKMAAVIFAQGCPFRCHYCHNASLVFPKLFTPPIDEEEIFSFLSSRIGQLEGVVITGGEPTMQDGLYSFIQRIKNLGFNIKLDTNGSNPDILKKLLEDNLLDFVAMDLKAPLAKYEETCGVHVDISLIQKSIALLLASSIKYEFRTTLVPLLHKEEDVESMAKVIEGAESYVLQNCLCKNSLNKEFTSEPTFSKAMLENLQKIASKHVKLCKIRYNTP